MGNSVLSWKKKKLQLQIFSTSIPVVWSSSQQHLTAATPGPPAEAAAVRKFLLQDLALDKAWGTLPPLPGCFRRCHSQRGGSANPQLGDSRLSLLRAALALWGIHTAPIPHWEGFPRFSQAHPIISTAPGKCSYHQLSTHKQLLAAAEVLQGETLTEMEITWHYYLGNERSLAAGKHTSLKFF